MLEDGSAGVSAIFKAVVDAAVEAAARVRLLRQIVCPNCDAEKSSIFGETDTRGKSSNAPSTTIGWLPATVSSVGGKAPMTAPAE